MEGACVRCIDWHTKGINRTRNVNEEEVKNNEESEVNVTNRGRKEGTLDEMEEDKRKRPVRV